METAILDSLLFRQKKALEKQKQMSREKVAKGEKPTENFTFNKRENVLLRNPENYAKDWAFCVPPYFNDALDIRLTRRTQVKGKKRVRQDLIWSQGSFFRFSRGDIIYDVPCEEVPWAETMKKINIALQVKKAFPVALMGKGDNVHRFSGAVLCAILTPDEDRKRIVERGQVSMSQDEFVRVLINGPNEAIRAFLNVPRFDANGQGLLF
jgi:hypothetical protein